MGFSSIVGAIVFLFIFAGMATFAIQATKQITSATQQEGKAAALNRAQAGMQLSITDLEYSYAPAVAWTDDAYADFTGTLASTTIVSPGTVSLVGPVYAVDGTYTSQPIDSGFAGTNYTTISWTSIEPALTSVSFQMRSGASLLALSASTFTGPDGSASTFYTTSGSSLNDTVLNNARYFQYQALLDTNNTAVTPELQAVSISVVRNVGVLTINATNSGVQKLVLNATDAYVSGVRVPRNLTRRTLDRTGMTDQILWLPGQSMALIVFGTLTTPQPVSIANADATAAGTVS